MLAATRVHGPASSSTTGGLFSGSTSAQGKQTLFCRGTKESQHRYSLKQPLNASSTELFMNFKVNHLSREEAKDPRRHASTVLCSKHFSTGQGYTCQSGPQASPGHAPGQAKLSHTNHTSERQCKDRHCASNGVQTDRL